METSKQKQIKEELLISEEQNISVSKMLHLRHHMINTMLEATLKACREIKLQYFNHQVIEMKVLILFKEKDCDKYLTSG